MIVVPSFHITRRILVAATVLVVAVATFDVRAADRQRYADVPVPAGPGSQSPRLASGPGGSVVLSWLEPAADAWALRYSRWQDGAWQSPDTVTTGDNWFVNWADLPAVTPVSDDLWVAHWLVRRPAGGYAYDIHVAVSTDAGRSFGAPRILHGDGTDTEHGFVSVFPQSAGAGLAWLDGRHMADGGGMTLRSATLTAAGQGGGHELDDLICDCCQTGAAVTPDGPVVAYRDRTAAEVRDIYVARHIDGEWETGVPVAKDGWVIGGCPVNGPAVAAFGNEVVVAWFTAANDRPRVRLVRSPDSRSPFSAPVDVVDGNTLGRVGLALLDDGAAIVSALRSAPAGGAELLLARVTRDGDVGSPYALAAGLSRFSVPQLVRSGKELLVVWPAVGDDGVATLRSALLPETAPNQAGH